MTRFLILVTFVLAAVFAGVVCSGCGDSSPVPMDAGSDVHSDADSTADTGPGPILVSPQGCWVSGSERLDLLPGGSMQHTTRGVTENGTWTWFAPQRQLVLRAYEEKADALTVTETTLDVVSITATSMTAGARVWARAICR